MTDNEHNLSISTNAHTRIDKIRGVNQSISKDDDDIVTAAGTNIEAAKSSMKRRHYQRKRKEGTVEQIPSFPVESDPKIPTPPSLHTAAIKSENDEKEMDSDGREKNEEWIEMEERKIEMDSDGKRHAKLTVN